MYSVPQRSLLVPLLVTVLTTTSDADCTIPDCNGSLTSQTTSNQFDSPDLTWSGLLLGVSQLDSSADDLIRANVTLSLTVSGSYSATNNGSLGCAGGQISVDVMVPVTSASGTIGLSETLDVTISSSTPIINAGQTVNVSVPTQTVSICVEIESPAALAELVGLGSVQFLHSASSSSSFSFCSDIAVNVNLVGTLEIEIEYYLCTPCLAQTATDDPSSFSPIGAARTLTSLYHIRDRLLRRTPAGRHWINLYYRHSGAVSRIIREDPQLRRRVGALLVSIAPGLEALARSEEMADVPVIPPRAVALFDAVLRDLEHADRDGELAREIRSERAVLDQMQFSGRSFAAVWKELNKIGARDGSKRPNPLNAAGTW